MNSLTKLNRLTLSDLKGSRGECVIAQSEDDHKKLAIATTVNNDGSVTVLYVVYEGEVPLMQTPNVKDAMTRYNAIPTKPESVENKASL